MDVAVFQADAVSGKTDSDGAWHFDLQLPPYFAGRPIDKGAAQVLAEATVKDSAGHSESRGEPITVSEQPILITAIPEDGTLIPGFENQVFIVTAYPDGQPAATQIKVRGESVDTDAAGVAVIRRRAGQGVETLDIEARDKAGNKARQSVSLASRTGADQILLRTERAVYRAGERVSLHVLSTRQRGAAYIDVVKDGQTMLTRDVDLHNGEAELTLNATPDLAGTVDFHAYLIGGNAQTVADHRLAFVQPADELKIQATADSASYKPGDDARIQFRVTNSRGEGVRAALGLQIVDEAVFALAEKQPGFAKVFFYLEQEAMKPRYEIHSIGMPEVVTTGANRDLAGRALFAAADVVSPKSFDREFGRILPDNRYWEYRTRYWKRFEMQAGKLAERFSSIYAQDPDAGGLPQLMAKLVAAHDPLVRDSWGNDLVLDHPTWMQRDQFQLRSTATFPRNGADGLVLQLHVNRGTVLRNPQPGGTIDLSMEHDRGPFNRLADISGTIFDPSGAVVRGVFVTARSNSRKTMTAHTGEDGQFQFSGVLPGEYEVEITSAGFRAASCKLALRVRDRAVLSAKLEVGQSTESVEVTAMDSVRGMAVGTVGGVIGGIVGGVPSAAPPPQFALRQFDAGRIKVGGNVQVTRNGAILNSVKVNIESPAPHVRSWFPESLYINPEIITDKNGAATIAFPMADSITTWHMSMLASTTHGALGSAASSIKVFQDFFADLDLPVTLTQGDRVSIPVALYNYSGSNGSVNVHLQPEDWYTLVSDTPDKTVAVESGRVGAAQFTLEARRIGKFKLTLTARMTSSVTRADVLVREIEVVPNGREQTVVFNGRLEGAAEHAIDFPAGAIPDASKVFVRLYPSPISQVIEGMDSILRMPGGCFEQTSSSTYPNVLTLDYMKHTKKLTPEIHAKAEGFIANGYQRLLTFEVPGGGFSWFGQAPANKILTAYGLMEFADMAKVYDVDPNVIRRTQQWLASQQQPDGSWKPDTQFINEGATSRYNSDVLRITAYVAWALENTGYQGTAVEKARLYIAERMDRSVDSYTLAVLANFAVDYGKDRSFAGKTLALLLDAARPESERTSWTAEETGVYGGGASASVETTGLAVQALLKSGENSSVTTKALAYIASKKDANGAWGTTQATIMALRALLLSAEKGADARGNIELTLNGKPVRKIELTPDNNDLLQQFVFKAADLQPHNAVGVRFDGKGALAYQVVGSYFLPWDAKPTSEPLSIDVSYDRAQLAQDDIATATATIRNNLPKTANLVMVDLGIPPGFDLLTEDLQDYREKQSGQTSGRLQKFSLTATQAILYFDSFAPGDTISLKYRLRAKYPIRARTFPSRVYEYYEPEVSAIARPVQLEVRKK
jgi:hypothetical protein